MYAEIAVNIEAGLANNFHYHFPHAEPPHYHWDTANCFMLYYQPQNK
jgi:hypothetical protein